MRNARGVRYLVVIPPDRTRPEALVQEVDVDAQRQLIVGDRLLVDQLLVRVHNVVHGDEGYDATLVCTPDEL
jgi:hypothetical protein